MEDITQETQTQSQEQSPQVFDTQAQAPSSWMWGEQVAGEGDKPEWFKDTKYKSVSEQAKAYTELEKRLGGFVGAPNEYQIAEELGVDSQDPAIQSVLEIMKNNHASNEFANELLSAYVNTQNAQNQARFENEMKMLGENADYRIKALNEFASVNIPEQLRGAFEGMVTSAQAVEVMEAIMSKMNGAKVAPNNTQNASAITPESLRDMMFKTNQHGQMLASIDPEYKKKVDKAYADYYGG